MPLKLDPKVADKLAGTAGSILAEKGRVVHAIGPDETVYAAVAKLKEFGLGALFVMRGGELIGVISERDYARKIILEGRASKTTLVSEIMSSPVISVGLSTPLADCMRLMSARRIRHLPVKDSGQVVGVISIGDLIRTLILQQEETIEQLSTMLGDPYPG